MQKNKLYKLKEKYNNKTKAVIVGNGPSISRIDWDKIQNCSAREGVLFLACNRISMIFDQTNWRPDIYVCLASVSLTESQWRKSIDVCLENKQITSIVFDEYKKKSKLDKHHDNVIFAKNIIEHYRHDPIKKNFIATPINNGIIKSYSATTSLFQICDFLEIREIGVIGQDGYIHESGKNHFDSGYGFEASNFERTNNRILDLHKELKRYFSKKNVEIYNHSTNTILENTYPYVNIEKFILDLGGESTNE